MIVIEAANDLRSARRHCRVIPFRLHHLCRARRTIADPLAASGVAAKKGVREKNKWGQRTIDTNIRSNRSLTPDPNFLTSTPRIAVSYLFTKASLYSISNSNASTMVHTK